MSPRKEPVRLSEVVSNIIIIGVVFGVWRLSTAQIAALKGLADALGPALSEYVVPLLGSIVASAYGWLRAGWLRRRVSSPATAETLASAVLGVETARANGKAVEVPFSASKAARRVLGG